MSRWLFLLLLSVCSGPAIAGNWFGSGPWANATYYPGNLDGKYQAAVFGANISGVLGFALRDGTPTTTVTSQLNTTNSSSQSTVSVDPFQNYFVIFVEGRTYSGLTTAGINYNNNTVTGALLGTQPDFTLTTNSTSAFSTNSEITTGGIVDIRIPVTNVTQNIVTIGSNSTFTTNNTPITNIVTTNLTVLQTNSEVTNQTVLFTNNGVVTETNFFITNQVVSFTNYTFQVTNTVTPTISTNTILVFATNFTTNVTFDLVESNVLLTNPIISQLTNSYVWYDPTALLNRGLSGGYTANINSKRAIFTFSGNGQLSTPSQLQTINLTTNARGDVTSAQVLTASIPFQLNGIRVSFSPASTTATNALR